MNEVELKRVFSSNIQYFIGLTGKGQKEVAKDLGIAPTTFNTWCVGKILPTLPKLQKLAEYFGCDPEDLITPLRKKPEMRIEVNYEEAEIIRAYRLSDEGTKKAIAKLLDVRRSSE